VNRKRCVDGDELSYLGYARVNSSVLLLRYSTLCHTHWQKYVLSHTQVGPKTAPRTMLAISTLNTVDGES